MTNTQRTILVSVGVAVLAFLVGFGWQFTRARSAERQLETVSNELAFEKLEATLAAATIEADRGNYEIARQLASEFFTGLQADLQRAPPEKQNELQRILSLRDGVITAASRNDPQSGSLLAQLYSTYRVAFGDAPVTAQPAPANPQPAAAPATTTTPE